MKRVVLLLLLLGGVSGPAPGAVDPFYTNRMASGIRAYEQGNWEVAARQLRIACFGHLDEPVLLGDGLVRLALAEARLGDEAAFRRTFSRLVELEERFSAYTAARLPAALRQEFETQAALLVPVQTLRSTAGFARIGQRAELQTLAALPPQRRRTELEARLEAEPERPGLLVEMARLELELRRPAAALDWLDRLPASTAGSPPATCMRQQAASEAEECSRMDLDQPFCQGVPLSVIEFRLQCLVDAARWPEAAGLIAALDPESRGRRRIGRLERRVRDNYDVASAPPAPASAAAEPPPSAPASTLSAVPAPAEAEPATLDPAELAELRQRLDSAQDRDSLAALLADVEALAADHPASRATSILAAEVAYLLSDWDAAVGHFDNVGALGAGEARLAFYRAVALYESGDPAAAAEILRPVATRLERNAFVDGYVTRILTPGI